MTTNNAVRKPKQCRACPTVFVPTGNSQPWCAQCADFRHHVKTHFLSLKRTAKRGGSAGSGSGGQNEGGCHSQKYRDWFLMDVHRRQEGHCADCYKELTPEAMLMHHLDHNRGHNVLSNFAGVCKRCHQIEHECWLAFRKA